MEKIIFKKIILVVGFLCIVYESAYGDILTPDAEQLLNSLQSLQELGDVRSRLESEELSNTEEYKTTQQQIYNKVDKLQSLINEMADKPEASAIIKEEALAKLKQVKEKGVEFYEQAREKIGSWFK